MMQLIQSLHKAKRPELDLKDQRMGTTSLCGDGLDGV